MFGKLFGGKGKGEVGDSSGDGLIASDDPRIAQGYDRLKAYWDTIGPSDGDVITYLVNPQFQGAPAWPNMRQAFRVVRPPGSLIIASDGLADPFVGTDMTNVQGSGCEVLIEAPEFTGAGFDVLRSSWAFQLIESFARNVANWGGISNQLAANGVLSMELPAQGILPERWLASSGNVGCLVGMAMPGRAMRIDDLPFGPVDIIPLTLITPAELGRVVSGGKQARLDLASELAAGGVGHVSRLERFP